MLILRTYVIFGPPRSDVVVMGPIQEMMEQQKGLRDHYFSVKWITDFVVSFV